MIASLFDGIQKLGHTCHAVVLGDEPGPDVERFGEVACMRRNSLLDWVAVRRLANFCDEQQIDVIHTHDAASQFMAALLRIRRVRRGPRMLMTFHRSLGIESVAWRDRLRNAFACRMSNAVVTVSHERRAHFIDTNFVRPAKVVAIHNGIDVERFRFNADTRRELRDELGVRDQSLVLGAIGHFGPEKGLDMVIEACKKLSGEIRLVIAGGGNAEQQERLTELAKPLGERVTLLGFRRDVNRWFSAFDVFVHAPRLEAFGLVVAEAMAAGLPVVATRTGGVPEIVVDGETGTLVEPESPDALAAAIAKLVDSADRRREWGDRGREVAQDRFRVELQVQRYAKLYERLCAGLGPEAPSRDETARAAYSLARPL